MNLLPLVKRRLRLFLEWLLGARIVRRFPRGVDIADDLRMFTPSFELRIVFDVGANTGQSSLYWSRRFPEARVLSFEPTRAAFDILQSNVRRTNVQAYRLAFGQERSNGVVLKNTITSKMNQVVAVQATDVNAGDQEAIEIDTIDHFCKTKGIRSIGFLKIDTEGSDLAVLLGAFGLVRAMAIDFISLEVGMHAGNERHVPLAEVMSFMEQRQYSLFGIYEQSGEWEQNTPQLRRSDLVFISHRACERETRARATQVRNENA